MRGVKSASNSNKMARGHGGGSLGDIAVNYGPSGRLKRKQQRDQFEARVGAGASELASILGIGKKKE